MDSTRDILEAPCAFCGYSGPNYWQSMTHLPLCPWRRVGGDVERINRLRGVLKELVEDRNRQIIKAGVTFITDTSFGGD